MFGSLFRLGMLATLVGGSAFALVGPDRLKTYFDSSKESVLNAIDDARSMETKLDGIRAQIRDLDGESRQLKEDAIRRSVEVEQLREEIAEREAKLERMATGLQRARDLLSQGKGRYTIGHQTFTATQIEADAAEKLSLYEVQRETLASLQQTLDTKQKAMEIAEQNVGRAAALRIDLMSQVGLLEAQLQKFRAKQHFAATVDEVMDTEDLDSDLARAREMIREFEKELEVQDRVLDEKLKRGSAQPTEGIDYESLEKGEEDLLGRIDSALRGGADPTVAVSLPDAPAVH